MNKHLEKAREQWRNLKSTSGFKDSMLFLVFVCVSAVFWFILALNDSAQDHFNVKLQIVNQPDSVTFISDVPEKIGVTVSDKGTSLWRHGFLRVPTVNIDFKGYSSDGVLRFSYADFQSALKETFGGASQVTSLSIDSLQLFYTTNPGKKVPVLIECHAYPASGSIIEGNVKASPGSVYIYGDSEVLDTINYVRTEDIQLRDLTETTTLDVKIQKIRSTRILPSKVSVTIPVEPLVRREAMISVDAINVPHGEQMLLFPSKVPVEYYVAMSRLSDDEDENIKLIVNYEDVAKSHTGKLKVSTISYPNRLKNLLVRSDSVEYALVRE